MSDENEASAGGVDFAVVAYREEGVWQMAEVSAEKATNVEELAAELRRWPGDAGSLGMVSVDEDFLVIVRVSGATTRVLLSDITAATDWPIALSVLEHLGLPLPDDDDDDEDEDEQAPAGDLAIVADLGMSAMDMGALLDDYDLYPDEMLSDIANKLGFGHLFDEVVGVATH